MYIHKDLINHIANELTNGVACHFAQLWEGYGSVNPDPLVHTTQGNLILFEIDRWHAAHGGCLPVGHKARCLANWPDVVEEVLHKLDRI